MNEIIEAVGRFVFVENPPEKSDAVMIVGGSQPEQGEKAAELWKEGFAPVCIIGGGFSIKTGVFPGPSSKTDRYSGNYRTEYDFFKDVLIKNGVREEAILGENRSSYTRENAVFARQVCDQNHLSIHQAILVCKAFHARRSLMFYQSAFPATRFLVVPIAGFGIQKDNWFQSEYGIQRVLGELKRCGDQFTKEDIGKFTYGTD